MNTASNSRTRRIVATGMGPSREMKQFLTISSGAHKMAPRAGLNQPPGALYGLTIPDNCLVAPLLVRPEN